MKTISAIVCVYNEEKTIKEFVKEGHKIALTVFKKFDLITSSIKNKMGIWRRFSSEIDT